MPEDRNSYYNIIKAVFLFGGVKVFQILIGIIRNKIIAILLGPNGIGILGLITSSTDIVASITGCGLHTSAVREVSKAHSSGDKDKINITLTVLHKLVWITGIIGMLSVFLLSSYLSHVAFNNDDYTNAFKIVSIIMLFNQLSIGQTVLLQGTFHYRYVAKSVLYGNLLGLILTIPLFYIFKLDAIIPAIIISSFIALLLSWYFSKKIHFKKIKLTISELSEKGKGMLALGIIIALTGLMGATMEYLLRIYISHKGSVSDVGLFTAGITIASTYVSLILSSMGTDYAPRLASVAQNNDQMIQIINKQATLLVTILAPLIIIFLVLNKCLIILLYSQKFIPIIGMIEWVMFGMFFRAVSWSISFSFVARGDSKVFFWNELIVNLYSLGFKIIGFTLLGFEGLGIGFVLTYTFYTIHMYILARKRFNFVFNKSYFKTFIPQLLLCILCIISIRILHYSIYRYIAGLLLIGISTYLMLKEFNKMLSLQNITEGIKNTLLKK